MFSRRVLFTTDARKKNQSHTQFLSLARHKLTDGEEKEEERERSDFFKKKRERQFCISSSSSSSSSLPTSFNSSVVVNKNLAHLHASPSNPFFSSLIPTRDTLVSPGF